MTGPDDFHRPIVAADCVLIGAGHDDGWSLLLIERRHDPFAGMWALPGGIVEADESAEQAAARELAEETGVNVSRLEQIGAFSAVDRDPRGRVISIAFLGLVLIGEVRLQSGSDAQAARWFPLGELPPLAFDHHRIVARAAARLYSMMGQSSQWSQVLPPQLTVRQVRHLVEWARGSVDEII